jgi:hypothetical protein
VQAGEPAAADLPNLGGYEDYTRVVGGVLAFMGVRGFLGNLASLYDTVDQEGPEWAGFLENWKDILGDTAVTCAELVGYLNDHTDFKNSLPGSIADMAAKAYTHRLGRALARRNNVRYPNGLMLVKAGEKKRAVTWAVSLHNPDSPICASLAGESGESGTTSVCDGKDKSLYRGEGAADSPNSPAYLKMGESGPPEAPTDPCFACGGTDWWCRQASEIGGPGEWLCSTCREAPNA